MAQNPSASQGHPGDDPEPRREKARQDDPSDSGRAESGGMEDDPVFEGSTDPWAEADAGHPDESASDSLDQHPQPEDEATPNRDA